MEKQTDDVRLDFVQLELASRYMVLNFYFPFIGNIRIKKQNRFWDDDFISAFLEQIFLNEQERKHHSPAFIFLKRNNEKRKVGSGTIDDGSQDPDEDRTDALLSWKDVPGTQDYSRRSSKNMEFVRSRLFWYKGILIGGIQS